MRYTEYLTYICIMAKKLLFTLVAFVAVNLFSLKAQNIKQDVERIVDRNSELRNATAPEGDIIVTMTTAMAVGQMASINVSWTGDGSIIANGVEVKDNLRSYISVLVPADGKIELIAVGDVKFHDVSKNMHPLHPTGRSQCFRACAFSASDRTQSVHPLGCRACIFLICALS